ncbi:MAG: hypothetical protein N4A61_07990 [Pelagimonas sp.]|jgi:hypothetical protein|nr:hypothetical protein [Pelagimonas sp.]
MPEFKTPITIEYLTSDQDPTQAMAAETVAAGAAVVGLVYQAAKDGIPLLKSGTPLLVSIRASRPLRPEHYLVELNIKNQGLHSIRLNDIKTAQSQDIQVTSSQGSSIQIVENPNRRGVICPLLPQVVTPGESVALEVRAPIEAFYNHTKTKAIPMKFGTLVLGYTDLSEPKESQLTIPFHLFDLPRPEDAHRSD